MKFFLLSLIILLSGCDSGQNRFQNIKGQEYVTEDNIRYKYVTIDDRMYIAVFGEYGYITLTSLCNCHE